MSKKAEKEPAKQKETKSENEQKKVTQTENEDKVKKLEEEVAKLKKDKLLLSAEIENKRKDFQQRMEYVYKYGGKVLISQVLDFLVELEEKALKEMRNDLEDNLKSELKSQELVNKFKDHLTGIEIIKNNLKRRLEDEGVKEIEVKMGEELANSRYHELIDEIENDSLSEGTVVEVVEKGYFLHEEVLRRVKVKIAKKSRKN